MKHLSLPVLAGLLASVLSPAAVAWGGQGHRLVASIAEQRLTADTRSQVQALLALEGHHAMADVASWADELRERDPALGRRSAGWHYVNIADPKLPAAQNCRYQEPLHCHERNCVVAAIEDQGKRLADTSLPAEQRLEALKFVVHFVGDAHQPMHAGYGHDKGGNDHQVRFEDRGSNLHALWDSGMLRSRGLDDASYLQRLLALDEPATLPGQPVAWAEASCRISIAAYPQRRGIDQAYVDTHLSTAEQRLRTAGEHLGALLNQLLDPAVGQP